MQPGALGVLSIPLIFLFMPAPYKAMQYKIVHAKKIEDVELLRMLKVF